jgi:23S rRNA (uracil1939-C5)-methyltransferase
MAEGDYRARKREAVYFALSRHGLGSFRVAETVEVPPGTRRRCVFKIARRNGAVEAGFHGRASHRIVDMRECHVLTPALFALVEPLRAIMGEVLGEGEAAELHATQADNGFDLALRWRRKVTPALTAAFAKWASRNDVARITSGADILTELARPALKIAGADVALPPGAFLQATREGELFLQARVAEALKGAKAVADLFAGCGTFAFALARQAKVHAVESDEYMLTALASGARGATRIRPVTTERRDLFRSPLTARELDRFDAAVLDPPRAGAAAQIGELARSRLRRIAYVSCNAETFARDARALVDAGFRMGDVVPVDQFLWSEHIELVSEFTRG